MIVNSITEATYWPHPSTPPADHSIDEPTQLPSPDHPSSYSIDSNITNILPIICHSTFILLFFSNSTRKHELPSTRRLDPSNDTIYPFDESQYLLCPYCSQLLSSIFGLRYPCLSFSNNNP